MQKLKDIGERNAIALVLRHLKIMPNMPIPFGDDVSAYPIGDELLILKTDMLVDKTDVPRGMSLWHAARKAIVMNVSDFAAKGVKPVAAMVSLGLPKTITVSELEDIAKGLDAGASEYGIYILGGDTNEASDLIISISMFGLAHKNSVILRSGAKPGDIVAVTGFFGKTSLGLKILLENMEVPEKIRNIFIDAVLMPRARLNEGLALKASGAATAAIDSSDGLAWSLYEISVASNVGFIVDNPPIAPEVREYAEASGLDPYKLAFYGGEEYELVVTVKPELWDLAEKALENIGSRLIKIGVATAEKGIKLNVNGKVVDLEPRGWEHFKH
ncbi:MAG: thiamine-phosphate kinase [Candidatus Bathyarchaeia archaeon]